MKEIGVVHKIKRGWATVRFDRKTACKECRMCFMPRDENYVELKLKNTLNAEVGDQVVVGMGDRAVLTASFIIYIVPLILVTIVLGATYKYISDYLAIAIFIGTLVISFVGISYLDRYIKKKKDYLPRMLEIIDNQNK